MVKKAPLAARHYYYSMVGRESCTMSYGHSLYVFKVICLTIGPANYSLLDISVKIKSCVLIIVLIGFQRYILAILIPTN